LIQRWVDYLTAALVQANRQALSVERLQPFMDGLTCQLLAFSEFFGCLWVVITSVTCTIAELDYWTHPN